MDLGQSRRGVDMGPSALRVAGLQAHLKQLGHQVEDIGNVAVKQAEEMHYGEKRAKYLSEIAETCRGLAEITEKSLSEGFLPLVLGGDHSIAIGSCSGVSSFFRKQTEKDRLPVAGRAWRHEYAGVFALRQRARHAAGGADRLRRAGTGRTARLPAEGRAAQRGHRRRARSRRQGAPPGEGVGRARAYHARYRRARHARGDERGAALRLRRYRRNRRQPGHGLRGPERRAWRGNAGSRRRHLSRRAPGHGDDRRQRSDGFARSRRDQSGDRPAQQNGAAGRRDGALGARKENPASKAANER